MAQLTRRLDANWDMTFGRGLANYARGAEAVAQNVRSRLLLLQGEWFLDINAGVPYLQKITVRPADLAFTAAVLKQTILETDGVAEVTSFDLAMDQVARKLTVSATVTTEDGSTANIQVRY
jgi:hypothetical protein